MNWLLDSVKWDDDTIRLATEICRQSYNLKVVSEHPDDYCYDLFPTSQPLVCYGSIGFIKLMQQTNHKPAAYANWPKFECAFYYAEIKDLLLAERYLFLSLGTIKKNKDLLYEMMGQDNTIFIRPSGGDKDFTGQLLYKEEFETDLEYLYCDDSTLCVVSPPKVIQAEYRFVVVDGEVIAGSTYRLDGRRILTRDYPTEAWMKAQEAASRYQPDRAFTVDVCRTKTGFWVLELNSFSCAGLYKSDVRPIVAEVSRIAIDDFERSEK